MQLKPNKGIELVYTLLFLLGLLLLMGYFFIRGSISSSISEVILNLSTEVLGVAIIFFFLKRYIKSQEEEVFEQIVSLRQEVRGKVIGWDDERQDKGLFDLKAYIQQAESLWISGQNMCNLLPAIMDELVEAVKDGLQVKLLTLNKDRDDPVLNLIADAQKSRGTEEKSIVAGTQKAFKAIEEISEALEKQPKIKGEFVHKTLKWNPNCGIIMVKGKNKAFAKVKVAFYGPSEYRPKPVRSKRLRLIVDQSTEPEIFQYYEDHFSWLWEHLSNERVSIPNH